MSRPNSNLQGYVGVANSQVEVERIVFAAIVQQSYCSRFRFLLNKSTTIFHGLYSYRP